MSASCGAALVLRDITIASKSRVQVRSQELQFSAVVLLCVTLPIVPAPLCCSQHASRARKIPLYAGECLVRLLVPTCRCVTH